MTEQSWPITLSALLAGEDLSRTAAGWALREIMSGEATEAQIGAFMMALRCVVIKLLKLMDSIYTQHLTDYTFALLCQSHFA